MLTTKNLALIASLLSVTAAPAAFSADSRSIEHSRYVSPFVTYSIADSDRLADDSIRGGVMFGQVISQRLNLELGVISQEFEAETGGQSFEEAGIKLDALWFISRGEKFSPYLSTGIGAIETSNTISNATSVDPAADLGLGFIYGTKNGIAMRADVRHRILAIDENVSGVNESSFSDWQVNLGLVAPLGTPSTAYAAPVFAPSPVEDSPVQNETPTKPADSDNDGVADASDHCPETEASSTVDINGCTIIKTQVYFASGSSTLSQAAKFELDIDIQSALRQSLTNYTAAGHADSSGVASRNTTLSAARVNAVIDYLTIHGIDPQRIEAKAQGQSMPAGDNHTPEGRARNRRVEVRISK
jgi:OOP family OmpA-OmpF porin